MRIATQNLNWGGEPTAPGCDGSPRLSRLVPWLAKIDAEVLVLTEFKTGPLGEEIGALLAESGYPHLLSHPQGPYKLGTAIASRQPLTPIELPIPAPQEPWRSIGARVEGVNVFGFYFPLGPAKQHYWDWVLSIAEGLKGSNAILLGDFNTGKVLVDEVGESFDCQERHEALEALGFIDTWRSTHQDERDYTWFSSAGNGFRLDYIWASPQLASHVLGVSHRHDGRLNRYSDHSAVVSDFSIAKCFQ